MMKPCRGCPGESWCENRGCIVWNETSREQYFELERRSKQMNAEIDELEKLFGTVDAVGNALPSGASSQPADSAGNRTGGGE